MASISTHSLEFSRFSLGSGVKSDRRFGRTYAAWTMTTDSKSSERKKVEEMSIQHQSVLLPVPQREPSLTKDLDLRFNLLQLSEKELIQEKRFAFGSFVASEAMLDEEFWTAAWLRAESLWENRPNDRFADSQKRKFADQEFGAIKKRINCSHGQKSTCLVTVRKEAKDVKRPILKCLVGTLDLSIRYLLDGETYPGERRKAPPFCNINKTSQNRYGYVANLCVSKSARRQGIASNMLHFAVELAKSDGVEQVYVHVHRHNEAAQELYRKTGFGIVEMASSQLLEEQTLLLCLKL